MRSTGTPTIRRTLQVRSNPVPGGQHTDYVSQNCTSTLDCFAAYHRYVSQVRWRLRKDGQGEAPPCPGALRRDAGRSYVRARRGETTPRLRADPSTEGMRTRVWTRVTGTQIPRGTYPTSIPHPLCGGVAPQRRGGFPPPRGEGRETLRGDLMKA
ncbi:MAG: hypothetical protein LBM98_13435 [Oscillospiraceae bacterium]|nr:hypothetical protein [Oscillospiraceae bacterium]